MYSSCSSFKLREDSLKPTAEFVVIIRQKTKLLANLAENTVSDGNDECSFDKKDGGLGQWAEERLIDGVEEGEAGSEGSRDHEILGYLERVQAKLAMLARYGVE